MEVVMEGRVQIDLIADDGWREAICARLLRAIGYDIQVGGRPGETPYQLHIVHCPEAQAERTSAAYGAAIFILGLLEPFSETDDMEVLHVLQRAVFGNLGAVKPPLPKFDDEEFPSVSSLSLFPTGKQG